MTMKPMMPPRTTIMIGSSRLTERLDGGLHLFVVVVGDLVEHGVELAGLLADVDHVDHDVVDDPGLLAAAGRSSRPRGCSRRSG